jgi:Na+/H+ antiporter NhaD/arsenite permease-like protein
MKTRFLVLIIISLSLGTACHFIGLSREQSFIATVFSCSILGTLFFWEFRLSFVFIGSGILFLTHSVDLEHFIRYASLEVILFLIGMMIIVGMMKDTGVFHWLVGEIIRIKGLNGWKLFAILLVVSAVLSALMGEVSSIMVMMVIIFDITKYLKVRSVPLVISSVLATNIGSAATILGNPIGVLIALRGGLSFEDFLTRALPLSITILSITVLLLLVWYRRYVRELSLALAATGEESSVSYPISIDTRTKYSIIIFVITVTCIALHRRLETLLGIPENNLLIILPVIFAGIVLAYRHDKARYYIEHEVEWMSLLFFLFLFAQAGVIQASGLAQALAEKLVHSTGTNPAILSGTIIFSTGILSSILDNSVVVASFIPMVNSLQSLHISLKPLWWCLLFGACYGGNITVIGSTANIVALGILEKESKITVHFLEWLKIGLIVGVTSMIISYLIVILVPNF